MTRKPYFFTLHVLSSSSSFLPLLSPSLSLLLFFYDDYDDNDNNDGGDVDGFLNLICQKGCMFGYYITRHVITYEFPLLL